MRKFIDIAAGFCASIAIVTMPSWLGDGCAYAHPSSVGATKSPTTACVSGSGTICSVADLQAMSLSGSYTLGQDIEAKGFSFKPIGTPDSPFVGSLNGNGFAIKNLTINSTAQNVGLFGAVGNGTLGSPGSVTNLRLTNANISVTGAANSSSAIGMIAGTNYGTLSQIVVQGTVTGGGPIYLYIGGIAGENNGTISQALSDATVVALDSNLINISAGGIAGTTCCYSQGNGSISSSGAIGNVSAASGVKYLNSVGGLVGGNCSALNQSYATGQVVGGDLSAVGGLVGFDACQTGVYQSFATGSVKGGSNSVIGGLVGWAYDDSIQESFASGSATGGSGSYAAGFAGEVGYLTYPASISQSYSTGVPSAPGGTVGGLVGSINKQSFVGSSYWDTHNNTITQSAGGTPDTTAQLKCDGKNNLQNCDTSTNLPKGFVSSVWEPMNTKAVQPANGAYYPQLWALPFPITTFPLANYTPYTASVATVFDHSPETGPGSGLASLYSDVVAGANCKRDVTCCDHIVEAFDGQMGLAASGYQNEATCDQAGYGQTGGTRFKFSELNYVGCGTAKNSCGGPYYLNYEGHPGFDYPTAIGTQILAPVSGTIFYPLRAIGTGGSYATYCVWHAMEEIPDIAPTYRIQYLHLSTHPAVANQGYCSGVPGTSGTTGVTFSPPSGCIYEINGASPPYQFPLPPGTHIQIGANVQGGCPIAETGWAGLAKPQDAHLHFEIDQIVPAVYWGMSVPPGIQYFHCWNENDNYAMKTPDSYCLPMDPYGWVGAASSCPSNPMLWSGDIWSCLTGLPGSTGIASRRFWAP